MKKIRALIEPLLDKLTEYQEKRCLVRHACLRSRATGDSIRDDSDSVSVKQALNDLLFGNRTNLLSPTRREAYSGALLSICQFFGSICTDFDKSLYFEPLRHLSKNPEITNELVAIHKATRRYIDSKCPFVQVFENVERICVTLTGQVESKSGGENSTDPILYLLTKEGYRIRLGFTDRKQLRNYREGQVLDCLIVSSSLNGKKIQYVREYDFNKDKPMLQLILFSQDDLNEIANVLKPLNLDGITKWDNGYPEEDYLVWSLMKFKKEIELSLLANTKLVMYQS
ncbi:MAG: hypothetical protein EOO20_26645 [Chryseobacterium sp.]|nr:MAG: hypothetical protein EOO20_26645 [Chryseobacterium sp.]